ncbi:transposase [Streptosporangium lutulentum]|uniref:transposase n=1 Tax=Streptosporangium lutulentum TaxID=1461250 RepID=UPI00362F6E9D
MEICPKEKVGSWERSRRRFDPEFRAGAVRIVQETGKSIAQVAKDLGINAGTLANWVQMDRLAREQDTNGGELAESEREELAWLRRQRAEWAKERAELEMERDDTPMLVKQRWSRLMLVTGLQG